MDMRAEEGGQLLAWLHRQIGQSLVAINHFLGILPRNASVAADLVEESIMRIVV